MPLSSLEPPPSTFSTRASSRQRSASIPHAVAACVADTSDCNRKSMQPHTDINIDDAQIQLRTPPKSRLPVSSPETLARTKRSRPRASRCTPSSRSTPTRQSPRAADAATAVVTVSSSSGSEGEGDHPPRARRALVTARRSAAAAQEADQSDGSDDSDDDAGDGRGGSLSCGCGVQLHPCSAMLCQQCQARCCCCRCCCCRRRRRRCCFC